MGSMVKCTFAIFFVVVNYHLFHQGVQSLVKQETSQMLFSIKWYQTRTPTNPPRHLFQYFFPRHQQYIVKQLQEALVIIFAPVVHQGVAILNSSNV